MLLAALPELALNLLSGTRTQTSIHFHYSAVALAALLPAAVLGAAQARSRAAPPAPSGSQSRRSRSRSRRTTCSGRSRSGVTCPGGQRLGTTSHGVDAHDRITARALELVPDGAVVSASNSVGAHLSERRRILSFPRRERRRVGRRRRDPARQPRLDRARVPYARVDRTAASTTPRFRLVFERDGVLVFERR